METTASIEKLKAGSMKGLSPAAKEIVEATVAQYNVATEEKRKENVERIRMMPETHKRNLEYKEGLSFRPSQIEAAEYFIKLIDGKTESKSPKKMSVAEELHFKQKLNHLLKLLHYKSINKETGLTNEASFVNKIAQLIYDGYDFKTKLSHEKIARENFGLHDEQKVRELCEAAIYRVGRTIAARYGDDIHACYQKLVGLYQNQPMSTNRTSLSVALQQYSTPIYIGYLMGVFCGINKPKKDSLYFEPTCGNAFLTVAGSPEHFIANEIDNNRYENLSNLPFKELLKQDALQPFPFKEHATFDALIANPPFGATKHSLLIDGSHIHGLEDQIIVKALQYCKPNAKAAVLIGGIMEYDERGRITKLKDKSFFNYLAKHWYISDVININGDMYARQGTRYDIRVILLNGRKETPEGYFPLNDNNRDVLTPFSAHLVNDFDTLFSRFKVNFQ